MDVLRHNFVTNISYQLLIKIKTLDPQRCTHCASIGQKRLPLVELEST